MGLEGRAGGRCGPAEMDTEIYSNDEQVNNESECGPLITSFIVYRSDSRDRKGVIHLGSIHTVKCGEITAIEHNN